MANEKWKMENEKTGAEICFFQSAMTILGGA
jgi:hypothetical protein